MPRSTSSRHSRSVSTPSAITRQPIARPMSSIERTNSSLVVVGIDAADEVAVDLHVVGLQLGPRAQARGAGAEIVDGDRAAGFAQPLQRRAQARVVIEQAFFGQLDHAAIRRHARAAPRSRGSARRSSAPRRSLSGETLTNSCPATREADETLERALDAEEVELAACTPLRARRLEQILRRVQPAVGRAAGQRFEAADAARARIDDGLEQGRDAALAHELGELVRRGVQPAQAQRRRIWA